MSAANPRVLISVGRRQLSSYLGNPVGYLFMLVFVVATMGFLLFVREDAFFTRNIADLQFLYDFMPWALAVLLPVLGMGAWATEREHGTDELLLTLPVSFIDAVLGKYLAIMAFFTIALAICALTAISVLAWLGSPDGGLLAANFIGWWLLGAVFAAFSLVASMLVTAQAVAFVLGVLFCALLMSGLSAVDLSGPFERGIIALSQVILALMLVAVGLALALLRLASRRWRPGNARHIALQVVTLLLCLGIAVNGARLGERFGADVDITADGLSSVSNEARDILAPLETPVEMTVVVTADQTLPDHLQLRAKEVLDMARALQRVRPELIDLRILRPVDRIDEQGAEAVDIHGLQPRSVMGETVVGNEMLDAFMGASVRAAGESLRIPYFHPGLSVEYELVRAVRVVSRAAAPQTIPEVELTIAMSRELPESLAHYHEEVAEYMASLAAREGALVEVSLVEVGPQPTADEIDGQWLAVEDLGLEARSVRAGALGDEDNPTASAGDEQEVVFAAHAHSTGVVRREQWLGESEDLSQALNALVVETRNAATVSQPVLGILATDLQMHGGFDMQRGQLPRWEIVNEWSQQYEIREVRPEQLTADDFAGVDVLVAALPSSLPQESLTQLYEWIWQGNPTLLLVDPFPLDALNQGRFLAPSEPPEQPPQARAQGAQPEPKGNIHQFLQGLGLEWVPDEVLWSSYNPAPTMRALGPNFVWMNAERGAIAGEHPITAGVDMMMAIYPGIMTPTKNDQHRLQLRPLLRPVAEQQLAWGTHSYHQLLSKNPFPRLAQPGELPLHPDMRSEAMIAAQVQGRAAHPYRQGQNDQPLLSDQDINAVVVADTDLAASVFFNFYRDIDGQISDSDMSILTSLRNVQFLGNAIDVLMGDQAMTKLRARRPSHRLLTRMEAVFAATQQQVDNEARLAEEQAAERQQAAQQRFDDELAAIDSREDLSPAQKRNLKASVRATAERRLQTERADIERAKEARIDIQRRQQRRTLAAYRDRVKIIGIGVPALALSLLVLGVFALRLRRERKDIPLVRARSQS